MSQEQAEGAFAAAPGGMSMQLYQHQMVYSTTSTTTQEAALPAAEDVLVTGIDSGNNVQYGQDILNTNQGGVETAAAAGPGAAVYITSTTSTRREESTTSYAVDNPQVIMQMQAQSAAAPAQTGTFGGFAAVDPIYGQYNTYGVIPQQQLPQQYYYQQPQPGGVFNQSSQPPGAYNQSNQPLGVYNQSSQPAGVYNQSSQPPSLVYDQSSRLPAAYNQSSQDTAYAQSRPPADDSYTQTYDPDYAFSEAYNQDFYNQPVYGFASAEKTIDGQQREAAEKVVHDQQREATDALSKRSEADKPALRISDHQPALDTSDVGVGARTPASKYE